jgi:ubiquinone/menaquinone biosynthesis C-methylase UbiE
VQQASADDLPFEDRSYDRYVANLCLMLVPDFPKSVSEAARVLRPGGMLGATLWGDRAKSPFFTIQPKVRNLCFLRSNPRYQGAKLVFHFFKQKVACFISKGCAKPS